MGRRLLTESESFKYVAAVKHWLFQLAEAADAKKTVIIFLPEYEEAFYDTGRPDRSGKIMQRYFCKTVV